MRDIRDPEEVYRQILLQKTGWNCTILEAADRVEQARPGRSQAAPSQAVSRFAAIWSPDGEARQKGVQGVNGDPTEYQF